MTATSNGRPASIQASYGKIEAALCEELAGILSKEVGITDNFLDIGGDSLEATKLVAGIKERMNIDISINDIFDQPTLADLANIIQSKLIQAKVVTHGRVTTASDYTPFQLLGANDLKKSIIAEISPYLKEHHSILDIYPATFIQQISLHDPTTGQIRPPTVFYMDFPYGSDPDTLVKAVKSLIEYIDIFRTVFVSVTGMIYQVVLKHLEVPIECIKVEDDIKQAIYRLAEWDFQNPLSLSRSLLRVAILEQPESSSSVRVVFRMSHALYDALSFKHILKSLHAIYNRQTIQPLPKFAQYMQLMACSQKDSVKFWRSALDHSVLAVFQRNSIRQYQPEMNGMWFIEKFIDAPLGANPYGITPATIFTTACGQMLLRETGLDDIVFGQVVSGRQHLPASCQNMIGPCANYMPTRIAKGHSLRKLLRNIQDQYLRSLPFETLGFDDMRKNCTDWSDQVSNYGCCTVYQGFDMQPQSQIGNQRIRWKTLGLQDDDQPIESTKPGTVLKKQSMNMTPLQDLSIVGIAQHPEVPLRVFVAGSQRVFTEDQVESLLDEIASNIRMLNSALQHPLDDEKSKD